MIDEWYPPSEIWSHWWKPHCIWVIVHLSELREGHYPTRDGGSGYTDGYGSTERGAVKPRDAEELYAEMDRRLIKCGIDGIIIKMFYLLGETPETIGKHLRVDAFEIERRIRVALKYIARKDVTRPYHRWYYVRRKKLE